MNLINTLRLCFSWIPDAWQPLLYGYASAVIAVSLLHMASAGFKFVKR